MLTDDWYPFRRHLAIGTDGTLTRTGEVDIFDADTGVPVETRYPSAPGQERGTGAVMGTVDVVEFATVEFEARAIEVYGQSGNNAPIKMQSPEGMVNEGVKAVVSAGVGDTGVAALLDDLDSETRTRVVALIEQIAPDATEPVEWGSIPQQPGAQVLTAGDGLLLDGPTLSVDRDALDASYVAATVLVGDGIDPTGTTDSTVAVQAAFDTAAAFGVPEVHVPAGTYVLDSVSLTADVTVRCAPGVVFRRAAGADTAQGSYWTAGAAMFEVDAPGLTVEFSGFTYDGNNTNQPTTEPTGFFLKTYPFPAATETTTVRIRDAAFTNGTSGYLCLRGDDSQRRHQTHVDVENVLFTDTVYGKGAGDPSTPTPLGYSPTYVHVFDYVTLRTRNFRATWDKPTGSGNYAAVAINATFYGQDFATSGETSIAMHGTTYLRGVGRSGRSYNDDDNGWNVNNGIGAIDMYGNAEELYIEHVIAEDCENVPVRAKASLRRYVIVSAVLVNCHRGLSVSPSSTGDAETVVQIGQVATYGGTVPQLEFIGNTTTNRIPSLTIGSAHLSGPMTDPEAYTTGGAANFRNISHLTVQSIEVTGAPRRAITSIDNDHTDLRGAIVDGAGEAAIVTIGGTRVIVTNFDVQNAGGDGVSASGNPTHLTIAHGRTRNTVNYGVFSNNSTSNVLVEDVAVETVTGVSRGFYTGAGDVAFVRNKTGTGVTNPLVTHASATPREDHNSWNPTESWGIAAPTAGTWVRGSKRWNTFAATNTHIGWVCTVAGTPGTWVPFGPTS